MAAAMRLVLPAHAVLPVSGSNTPTLTVPLLPACASAADGAASSSTPASAARWPFMLILPIASVSSSSLCTHPAEPDLAEARREFLFRRPCDHRCIANRGEEIARNIVAVTRHDPWHAGLVGELGGVAQRTGTDRQHDPVPCGVAHDVLPAATQNRIAFDRNHRLPRNDLRIGVAQPQQHVPAVIARHFLRNDALTFEDCDVPCALGDALGGLDANHAAADHGDA